MELNRVNIQEISANGESEIGNASAQKPKCYDLNSDTDSFWNTQKGRFDNHQRIFMVKFTVFSIIPYYIFS